MLPHHFFLKPQGSVPLKVTASNTSLALERQNGGCSSLSHSFSSLREGPSLDLDTTVSRAYLTSVWVGYTHSPQAQRGGARPLRVLEVCPALRAKAQGKHAISSSSRLRPASPSLISCSRSNLDHWRRQCRLHVGKAYATHKSKVLLTGPSGLMTQDVPTNTSACSLQWHLVWDSASPVQSFLLNCFLRCLSPSKRWRSPLNIYYSLHAA